MKFCGSGLLAHSWAELEMAPVTEDKLLALLQSPNPLLFTIVDDSENRLLVTVISVSLVNYNIGVGVQVTQRFLATLSSDAKSRGGCTNMPQLVTPLTPPAAACKL